MIWSILEARTEILTKKRFTFLGDLKTPKFPSEINWPLVPHGASFQLGPNWIRSHVIHHASYRLIIFRKQFFTLFSDNLYWNSSQQFCHIEFPCKLSDGRVFLKFMNLYLLTTHTMTKAILHENEYNVPWDFRKLRAFYKGQIW